MVMSNADFDRMWINAQLATMREGEPYGAVRDGAIGVRNGKIAFVGTKAELPGPADRIADTVIDADGRWITPGLIDCHTHIVYGGNRAREFELRLEGATYEEIARAGGGIRSTVTATRAASEDALIEAARPRLAALMAEGVTTAEIKSGYGLDTANEAKMLRAARRLGKTLALDVQTTFLGAHALPLEFGGKPDAYIDLVCDEMLPSIADEGLADAADAFCEGIGFTPEQTARVFEAAQAHHLPVKLHAEQLSNLGGAKLAASYGARSADHLEYIDEAGVAAMAAAGTVAVLLPGAFYFLRETQLPPVDLFRKHGVPVAIASDSNPGSSPATSLLLMLNMACTLFRMTPEEALAGVTRNAAKALGLEDAKGVLAVGMDADFVLWHVETPAELAYRFGFNPCAAVVKAGAVTSGPCAAQ